MPDRDALDSLLIQLFHRLNSAIPEQQEVVSVPPEMPVREAFYVMSVNGFSQLPVKRGAEILGVFSYRAFSARASEIEGTGLSLDDVPVSEFLESLVIAR